MKLLLVFSVIFFISGCHNRPVRDHGVAPVGKVPSYITRHPGDSSSVWGKPGVVGEEKMTPECAEYRGMMTAPIEPMALKNISDKCKASMVNK